MSPLVVTANVVVPASELTWTAVRSGGPGGQNVNKVSTKVELRFAVRESQTIAESVKERMRKQPGLRWDANGALLLTCETTRSQAQNLERARLRLVEIVRAALLPPKRRRPTRPSKGSILRRLEQKSQTSRKKAERRGLDAGGGR